MRNGDKKPAVNCHVGAQGSLSAVKKTFPARACDSRKISGEMHRRYLDEGD